jgi:hypothetical protein
MGRGEWFVSNEMEMNCPAARSRGGGSQLTRAARFMQDEKNKIPYRPFNPHPSSEL